MARLSYQIVLEMDNKEPVVFHKSIELKGVVNKNLINETLQEARKFVETDLQEHMIVNSELFENKRRTVKIMTPGGAQDAQVRKGDGTGSRR